MREQTTEAVGRLTVEASTNGSVSVNGWRESGVLVRARIDTWAASDAEARALASRVQVAAVADSVRAVGPAQERAQGWSVRFEIFVPQDTGLNLSTLNGSVAISDVRGHIEFEAKNGAVRLTRIAGDVKGSTTNGAVEVELAGNTWDGSQLDVKTTNGSVTLSLPAIYSAHIYTRTTNGRIASDFPVTVSGRIDTRERDFNVGSGGPPIRLTTTNGQVRIRKS
jgi:hypothetical protein